VYTQLESAVGKICELQVKPLLAIMENSAVPPPKLVKNSVTDPVLYLDRLSDVFRHVAPSNGCVGQYIYRHVADPGCYIPDPRIFSS
jgi:hypothetical protein